MPVSIFTTQTPDVTDAADASTYSLGTKWFSSETGTVTHGRWFFPDTAPTGSVSWVLYDLDTQAELARATFSSNSPGWQTEELPSPVPYTTPLTVLVAVVETTGRYVATPGFFSGSAVTNSPLTAPADGSNGRVGVGSGFPTGTFSDTCYFADLVFSPDGEAVSGEVAATLPALAAAGTATLTDGGDVDPDLPPPDGALSAQSTTTGDLAAVLPALTTDLGGSTSAASTPPVALVAALARGRAAAERLMVDTCTIRRRTGESTDPDSGVVTPTYDTVYEGRCRVQQSTGSSQATEEDAGEAHQLMLRFEVQVPVSVTGVQADDEVLITASVHDPDLVDREFLVRGLAHKTHAVMRRLQVQEATS